METTIRLRPSLIGFAAAACLAATPAISLRAGEDLFPVKNGAIWTYTGTAGEQKLTMTAAIASVNVSGGKSTVTFKWTQNGQPIQDEVYLVTADAVSRLQAGANGMIKS